MAAIADVLSPAAPAGDGLSKALRTAISKDLQVALHVTMANPAFAGPTREQSASAETMGAVRAVVAAQLGPQLEARRAVREMLHRRVRDAEASWERMRARATATAKATR